MNPEKIEMVKDRARRLRIAVVDTIYRAKDGHVSPSLSAADIVATLYFGFMNIKADEPRWPDRDRFVLSKGHACPVLYAALAQYGFFPSETLLSMRSFGSLLQGHPDMNKTPGVDATAGSLGNGLAIGLGMAAARKLLRKTYRTYVILGDGELQEGVVWEAVAAAAKLNPGNLIAFVDQNGYQSGGVVAEIGGRLPLRPKFESFGWRCLEIDGHDIAQIASAIETAQSETERPVAIIAKTVKGRGVSFMIDDNSWHKRALTDDEYTKAMEELERTNG
jgi:transketolase